MKNASHLVRDKCSRNTKGDEHTLQGFSGSDP